MLVRVAATAALLAMLAGCSHAPSPGTSAGPLVLKEQRLSLYEGQSLAVGGGTKVRFANVVNDSRCPKGAQCIWAGTATVRLVLMPPGGDSVDVLTVLGGGVSREDEAAMIAVDTLGTAFTLLELVPYPVAGESPQERKRALFKIAPLPAP